MYLVCQTIWLSDYWTVWLSGCQIIGLTSFNIGYLVFVLHIQVKLKGCENYKQKLWKDSSTNINKTNSNNHLTTIEHKKMHGIWR
jgi:hypothetical protein